MRRLSGILLVSLALSATAMAADERPEVRQVQADNRDTVDRIMFECGTSYKTAELDPIRDKVNLSGREQAAPPAHMLADATYPTPGEARAIAAWSALRESCVKKVSTFLDNVPLPANTNRETASWGHSFFVRGMTATGELVAALGQGRLTYGEFARRRAELIAEVDADHRRWRDAMRLMDTSRRIQEAEQADRRLKSYLQDMTASLGSRPPVAAPVPPSAPASTRLAEAPLVLDFPKGRERPDDIAVIIGNGDYTRQGRDIPDVRPAHADAASIRLYVSQALGISDGNIILLRDATAAQMAQVFGSRDNYRGQLFDWVKPGRSRVFVYYAGHGAPSLDSGGPYLVPTDADSGRIGLSGYPLAQLYDNLGRLPAESVTLVLEACFSGQSPAGSLVGKASPILLESKATTVPANLTVISAAGGNQIANWEQDETHGLFTVYFLKGMSGEADKAPFGNGDGSVTLDELDRYLGETVTYLARRYYGRDQTAQIARGTAKAK